MTANVVNGHENGVLNVFYRSFPYPWPPRQLVALDDPAFYTRMIAQDVGDYGHTRLAPDASIWVAGCGTNQALITALRFPSATVLGTDASERSLEMCAANAAQLGVTNLELRHEGITQAAHQDRFDYVLCTGVIHHNPDPTACLRRLTTAMRPDAVLELMVYNTFHRQEIVRFQQALTVLGYDGVESLQDRLSLARRLSESVPADGQVGRRLEQYEYMGDEGWADSWMSPLEHDYTVERFWALAEDCGLTVEAPAVNVFDQVGNTYLWEVPIRDPEVRERYEGLPDRERWQVSNLLLMDSSPMMWFYAGHAARGRLTAAEHDEAFLDTVFTPTSTRRRRWVLDEQGRYHEAPSTTAFPDALPPARVRPILDAVDGKRTMREVFADFDPALVRAARVELTTSLFPFLTTRRQ